jgi:DNA polymerase
MKLTLDFETRSTVDLGSAGPWKYAADQSTDVLCLAVKPDAQVTQLWIPDWLITGAVLELLPPDILLLSNEELLRKIDSAGVLEAHNAEFERSIWKHVMGRYGFPEIPLAKWDCTAARAATCALPRQLKDTCRVLHVSVQKDMEGHRLMLKLCKPRLPRKAEKEATPTWQQTIYWHEDPKDFVRLFQYCIQDVEAEHALSKALRPLSSEEKAIWRVDQSVNERGVAIDLESITGIIDTLRTHEKSLLHRMAQLTGGMVESPRQVAKMTSWLAGNGVVAENLQKHTVAELLQGGMPDNVRQVLEIRQSLGKASTAKFQAMLDRADEDGRARALFLYHAASTGRYGGKAIQPQNMPRDCYDGATLEEVYRAFGNGDTGFIDLFYDDPFQAASRCIRGALTAGPGKELICADYNSIEARGNAWLAGEESILAAFRDGLDLYKVAATGIFGVEYEAIDKTQRQLGKTCIAEGQLVLTDAGLIPIERVPLSAKVWDGEEFVAHDGPIYKGEREVITYEGLTATPDHTIYTEEGDEVELRTAAWFGKRLSQTGIGGSPIRHGRCHIPGHESGERTKEDTVQMHGMPRGEMGKPEQPCRGENWGVPEMQSASSGTKMAVEASYCRAKPVQEQKRSKLQALRGAWNRLQIFLCFGSRAVGTKKSRITPAPGTGPGEQPRELRSRKSPVVNAKTEHVQYEKINSSQSISQIQGDIPICKVCGQHPKELAGEGSVSGGYSYPLGTSKLQTKRRVWDLLNCGPRNRFTVSGKLVHNCVLALGYQGGIGAFAAMAVAYSIDLETLPALVMPFATGDELDGPYGAKALATTYLKRNPEAMSFEAAVACDVLKRKWRVDNPNITVSWKSLENAAVDAVINPGQEFRFRRVVYRTWRDSLGNNYLLCKLPSGRILYYFDPQIREITTPWDATKEVITYYTVDSMTKQWVRRPAYGGLLCENNTQAMCRDIMAQAMVRCEDAGYPVVLHAHDEIVSEVPEGTGDLDAFCKILIEVPTWATGMPIAADGWVGKRYRK